VEDLGVAAGADHTVVVRLRADARILEATLVSSRAGVPSSTTMLPLSDLEDPGPMRRDRRREAVAVPIDGSGATAGPVVAAAAGAPAPLGAATGAPAHGAPGAERDSRPRIRDRAIAGMRGGLAPLDEWE